MLRSSINSLLQFGSLLTRTTSRITSVASTTKFKSNQQRCSLHLHEFQAHQLLKEVGVNVPEGGVAETPDQAEEIAQELDTQDLVIKAQVHTGGRGKGEFVGSGLKGGVHLCNTPEEIRNLADRMIGYRLVTKQSGPEGKPVTKVFIVRRHFIRREMYFAILYDRETQGPVLVGSAKGGMDIELVASETPQLIFKEPIDIVEGIKPEQIKKLAGKMGVSTKLLDEAAEQITRLYNLFLSVDATLIEVNPFAETASGRVMAVDAKINIDDNALFRQPKIEAMRDISQEDPRDVAASEHNLSFIGLDGDIGCLVNGAGLAMATMDMIKLHGGTPANFLDVGGGATEKQVTEALKIVAKDPNVRAVLVNIFGGIMKCDIIAIGILNAAKSLNLKTPLVVRLQGTRVEEAKNIIESSGLRIIAADDLDDAAEKSVRVAKIVSMAREASLHVSFELPL